MIARRLTPTFLCVFALALAAAGCGGDGGSQGSLSDSLGYLPKDAPLVITMDTDLKGEQYQNLDTMLKKFPFSGQVKNQIKQSIAQAGVDYEKDVEPLLGKQMVIAVTDARSLVDDTVEDRYVVAFPAEGGSWKKVLEKDKSQRKSGEIDGSDVYESADGSVLAIRGKTLVGASERADLEAALKRHGGDDTLTEDEFNAPFQGLPTDAMTRVYGDIQAMLAADPGTAEARRIRWVNGLRKFGATATAQKDGVQVDARVTTEGLQPADVPYPTGEQAPGVARFGDWAAAQRNLAHSIDWGFDAAAQTKGEDAANVKRKLGKALGGIDVERDLFAQFSGDTTVAGQVDGTWGLRSDVKDPDAMRATLEKMRKGKGTPKLRVSDAGDLIKLTDEDGEEVYAGMVGDVFVAGRTPERAKQMAAIEPKPLQGVKGAQVFVADGESIAKAIIERSGQNQAAGLFTGPIGDLTGYVTASPEDMRLSTKLKVE